MAFTSEGTIEIDLPELWEWVHDNYLPVPRGSEVRYGVPRINRGNSVMEIDFAAATECDPADWAVKPKAVTQWESTGAAQTESPTEGGAQHTIELRVSQNFYDVVTLLAKADGISKADVIRRAVELFAREAAEGGDPVGGA
jgi:hypothetical protein